MNFSHNSNIELDDLKYEATFIPTNSKYKMISFIIMVDMYEYTWDHHSSNFTSYVPSNAYSYSKQSIMQPHASKITKSHNSNSL